MKGWGRYRSLAPVLVLALLCLVIASINSNFLSVSNFIRLLSAAAIPMVLVMGATFVILMGSIDLSVEGVVALTAVVVSMMVANDFTGLDLGFLSLPVALLVGGLIGFANGLVHVRLQIPSFMTTLGIGFACVGIATAVLGGYTVRISDRGFRDLTFGRILDVPILSLGGGPRRVGRLGDSGTHAHRPLDLRDRHR